MTITDTQVEAAIDAIAKIIHPWRGRKQARFWIATHTGGSARIKLNLGQALTYTEGGPTDEGYSYTSTIYGFDGNRVTYTSHTRACDCDGVMHHHHSGSCPVSRLAKGVVDDGVTFPAWEYDVETQRDFSAEAAGY